MIIESPLEIASEAVESFDPLSRRNLAESVVRQLMKCKLTPLGSIRPFLGAGVYAVYYTGQFPLYLPIQTNDHPGSRDVPIYAGKAVHSGGRVGANFFDPARTTGAPLFKRLQEHFKSIAVATNLQPQDFHCRYLVCEDIFISLAEPLLISETTPLWNVVIDGFGNHDPGGGRRVQRRSAWDVLHPGRMWAEKQGPGKSTESDIVEKVQNFYRTKFNVL